MRYRAVVFDLFGTLVDNFREGPYADLMERVRRTLGIDDPIFHETWDNPEYTLRRMRGDFATFEECLRDVCRAAGVAYDPSVVPAVVELRRETTRRNMAPRPDTVETLRAIRRLGLKVGLVSDCTWHTVEVWPETPMATLVDEAIFSCEVRLKKPDPRIYALICDRLGVAPADCLYIGDCGSDELVGARRAGMDAALICTPDEEDLVMCRPEAKCWDGPRISSVREVLGLLNDGNLEAASWRSRSTG